MIRRCNGSLIAVQIISCEKENRISTMVMAVYGKNAVVINARTLVKSPSILLCPCQGLLRCK